MTIIVVVDVVLEISENITDDEVINDITEAINDMLIMDRYETSKLQEVNIYND